jgi:hypothetical protein
MGLRRVFHQTRNHLIPHTFDLGSGRTLSTASEASKPLLRKRAPSTGDPLHAAILDILEDVNYPRQDSNL